MTSSYHDKEVGKTIIYKLPLFAIDLKFKKSEEKDIKKGGEEDIRKCEREEDIKKCEREEDIRKGGEEDIKKGGEEDIKKCERFDDNEILGGYHNKYFNKHSKNSYDNKHSRNSYDNKHSKTPSDINLYNLIITKRTTLYDTLNKISDFAPVIYRFIIKNSSVINMYNIKNLLSSYLKEVDIDYNKAIKKNITVDTDWTQLYHSLL